MKEFFDKVNHLDNKSRSSPISSKRIPMEPMNKVKSINRRRGINIVLSDSRGYVEVDLFAKKILKQYILFLTLLFFSFEKKDTFFFFLLIKANFY